MTRPLDTTIRLAPLLATVLLVTAGCGEDGSTPPPPGCGATVPAEWAGDYDFTGTISDCETGEVFVTDTDVASICGGEPLNGGLEDAFGEIVECRTTLDGSSYTFHYVEVFDAGDGCTQTNTYDGSGTWADGSMSSSGTIRTERSGSCADMEVSCVRFATTGTRVGPPTDCGSAGSLRGLLGP